jgi:hypothetical protein
MPIAARIKALDAHCFWESNHNYINLPTLSGLVNLKVENRDNLMTPTKCSAQSIDHSLVLQVLQKAEKSAIPGKEKNRAF